MAKRNELAAVGRKARAQGAPKKVLEIRKLALAAREGDEPVVRTYVIAPEPKGKRGVSRAGGAPIGVTEKTRPRYQGAFMHHLLTLDLDDMPELRTRKALASARAVALFISSWEDNEAFARGTKETKVVVLSAADVRRGEWTGEAVSDPRPRAISTWPVDVPARVFTFDRRADDVDDDAPLRRLHDKLMSACRAGGPVIHWSRTKPRPEFLFQFNDDLVDVNLGDAGKMYAFEDGAYWICH